MIEIPVNYTIQISEHKIIQTEGLTKQSTLTEIESACYHYIAGLDDLEFYYLTEMDKGCVGYIIDKVKKYLADDH